MRRFFRRDPTMYYAAQGVGIGTLMLLGMCLAAAAIIAGWVVVRAFLGLS